MPGDSMTWRSLNAPFTEEGQSLIQRDIETLFLALQQLRATLGVTNNGNPTNSGQPALVSLPPTTQIGGQPITQVVQQNAPAVSYPISVANGGTGATTAAAARTNLGALPVAPTTGLSAYNGSTANGTVPAGCYGLRILLCGAGASGGRAYASPTLIGTTTDSASNTTSWYVTRASGGGGGAFAYLEVAVQPGDTVALTSGTGGAARTSDGQSGQSGGSSTVTVTRGAQSYTYTTTGGSGGTPDSITGGAGGTFGASGTLSAPSVYTGFSRPGLQGAYGGSPLFVSYQNTPGWTVLGGIVVGGASSGTTAGNTANAGDPGIAVVYYLY